MSGTSLDGLDIAYCEFILNNGQWSFDIVVAETIVYSNKWFNKLGGAAILQESELKVLHEKYGEYIGTEIREFVQKNKLSPELICSHGHTIFHDPKNGITYQLGSGEVISKKTGIKVVSNFRALDVSLGGQGAPLVPVGDKLLFPEYEYCLNLGGFGNISFEEYGERKSFDICPVNMALNEVARELDMEYDESGEIASRGNLDAALLEKLNILSYYEDSYPKSLSREWYEESFKPILEQSNATPQDKLSTLCEHVAIQIKISLEGSSVSDKLLITGGGTHNKYLVDQIKSKLNLKVDIPSAEIIDYKEALIFGFLGILRFRNEINCLKSVTGAERNSSVGEIHEFSG
ncbi:MAG: anhydro-N-acetylmuramic acid kinase [Bacteroidetes bacterium]|nr:MAG: anhydro-N-acetylmuramic acid kinase [Bacteroidota bacterium]